MLKVLFVLVLLLEVFFLADARLHSRPATPDPGLWATNNLSSPPPPSQPQHQKKGCSVTMTTEPLNNNILPSLIAELIPALIQVESGGDDSAVGDGGAAVGCLQIHKIYVDDVNRILDLGGDGMPEYQTFHRCNRKPSIVMATTYLSHYGKSERVNPTSRQDWIEKLAKIHHGGPNGYKNEDKDYFERVNNAMSRM